MNRPAIIFIITSLISSCSRPNFTSVNNTLPSSSNTIKVETNKTIAAENKVNTQINNESKTALEKDANLGVKLDGTIASTIAQATSTPQPTTYISASPSAYKGYDSSTNIQVVNPNVRETLAPGIPTPPTATSSNPIDFRDKPFGYYSDPNYGRVEAYSRQEEIPIGMRSGVISLIFKDEYKIRLKSHVDKQLRNRN